MDIAKESSKIYLQQNIRYLRKRMKFSQEELANRMGLNRGNIASYENGTAEPRLCNLLKFSTLFGISIMDLTQKDLSDEANVKVAIESFQHMSKEDVQAFHHFMKKADEIRTVVASLHTCHQYKAKSFSEMPKDVQIMLMNFEQLHDATQALLCNHRALLEFIKARLPENP